MRSNCSADPSDPLFYKGSWHNPKTMAHVPNTDYETNTEAMSNWVPPEKEWRPGKPTEFKRVHKNTTSVRSNTASVLTQLAPLADLLCSIVSWFDPVCATGVCHSR